MMEKVSEASSQRWTSDEKDAEEKAERHGERCGRARDGGEDEDVTCPQPTQQCMPPR